MWDVQDSVPDWDFCGVLSPLDVSVCMVGTVLLVVREVYGLFLGWRLVMRGFYDFLQFCKAGTGLLPVNKSRQFP